MTSSQYADLDTEPDALHPERHPLRVAHGTPEATDPPRPADEPALWALLGGSPAEVERAQRLGEALVRSGLIDTSTLRHALREQREAASHRLLGRILVERGALSEVQLRMALAQWLGVRVIDPRDFVPSTEALRLIARTLAEREAVLPLMVRDDTLVVLLADPWDRPLLDELRFITQHNVVPVMAVPGTLLPAIQRAYAGHAAAPAGASADGPGTAGRDARGGSIESLASELRRAAESTTARGNDVVTEADNTLVRLINSLIQEAIDRRASDIHIETAHEPRQVRIRLRIDGELLTLLELPPTLRYALVARVKIMADLDISEHRKPQDGKIDFARFGGPHVELRVVTVPTSRGLEDVVLRLLSGLKPMPLDEIGLSPANLQALRAVSAKPYGLILICGPTGCGKTTTLHSVLRELNTDGRKIWTAEDPIEITQDGLRQVQVNPRIGWTFANAMRTFLRADPDVIMIGEMRDEETARIAVEASLTGHLVLSTLHTNSAPESITRLLEIGLDPFNFSDSLLAILAQRLVRRLCTHCREAHPATDAELETLAAHYHGHATAHDGGHPVTPPGEGERADQALMRAQRVSHWRSRHAGPDGQVRLYRARGCDHCGGDGHHGRLGIHELMLADDTVRAHIRHRESAAVLQTAALAGGMTTLRQDGIEKVLAGLTDLAEVLGATNA